MLLCLEVHGTFSISHAILGFKRRERGKGEKEEKGMEGRMRVSGSRMAETWERRKKTASQRVFEVAYSALSKGLLDVELHAGSCKTASAEFCFSLILALFSPAFH